MQLVSCMRGSGREMSHSMVCVTDFEKYANEKLARTYKEYFSSGADQCQTLKENTEAFKRLRIRPKFLRDVSCRDLSTTLLGERVNFPVGVSSTALQWLAWPDGDICTAKGGTWSCFQSNIQPGMSLNLGT
ncbi:2-Hydroxyacid oxidase 2-like [Branchiostoma floridae x Branchiostoma japonicum]